MCVNARACARRESKRYTRERRVPRVSRARDTIEKPGGDARWTPKPARVRVVRPSRRGPTASPSTCDARFRVRNSGAETRAVRLDRAGNAGFECAADSAYLWRSLERELHDRRAVRAVVMARLRVRRPIETESQSPFFPSEDAPRGFFYGSKRRDSAVRADARFFQTRCTLSIVFKRKNLIFPSPLRYRNSEIGSCQVSKEMSAPQSQLFAVSF